MGNVDVTVPDIGDFKNIPIIEILVKPGDIIKADDPLISLESDKATMEVPAPHAGKVASILVKVGDRVSQGTAIIQMEGAATPPPPAPSLKGGVEQLPHGSRWAVEPPAAAIVPASMPVSASLPVSASVSEPAAVAVSAAKATPERAASVAPPHANALPASVDFGGVHASPGVRRLARELDVDLTKVSGSGENGRVTKEDVKAALGGAAPVAHAAAPTNAMGIPEIPAVDFAKFGPIEIKPLSRIKRLSGPHLHRAWLNIPHVTHTDEADITDTEAFRKTLDEDGKTAKPVPYRVSLLPFLMKAVVNALKAFPDFNSSLNPAKDALIAKHYYHIGIAVDTPDGLVVPVVRDVDRKGLGEISRELAALSAKARDGKLKGEDMQGGTFSISSLGGIGGTSFTPIVNAPEVAILGVVRSKMAPVWDGKAFQPRLMLPLCLSYDHRVIDGASAARFTRHLVQSMEDVRRLVL